MENFLNQINEDIVAIRTNNQFMQHIEKNEWVFNYWVLDNIYNVEPELIETQIIEYNDLGVDAFVFFEDTKDLYIIQNKYYSDTTPLKIQYVKNDFLLRPINALKNNTYSKSAELQSIFNKYKDHSDFTVHLELFVTNDNVDENILNHIKNFNMQDSKVKASIYYLEDIKNKYFGEIPQKVNKLSVDIDTVVKATILNINNNNYKLKNIIDARYVFTPITTIFKIYRDALEKQYPIFDKNIREYLGNTGVNKNITKTLIDKQDRVNFFYYNNGITLICNNMTKIDTTNSSNLNRNAKFTVNNPQIVNGCQTVNSIYEVLKNVNPNVLEDEFKDTFVMLKVLQINDESEMEKKLYTDIVRFNNSQNSIDEKNFVSNNDLFNRFQRELEKRGFLLLIKQSDKNTYKNKYLKPTKLKERSNQYINKFNLDFSKTSDFHIPLEKLLQVIVAFMRGGFEAFTRKNTLLKFNSEMYNLVIDFLKLDLVTYDLIIDLWLLYIKAETRKKVSPDKRTPIPYYVIDCFAKYTCNDRQINEIMGNLDSEEKINNIIKFFSPVITTYANTYYRNNSSDYNAMIKKPINYKSMTEIYDVFKSNDF